MQPYADINYDDHELTWQRLHPRNAVAGYRFRVSCVLTLQFNVISDTQASEQYREKCLMTVDSFNCCCTLNDPRPLCPSSDSVFQ